MYNCFHAADILIPQKISLRKWSCVACDQFSSQQDYWDQVEELVGDEPSTFNLIIPEAYLLNGKAAGRLASIHSAMEDYLDRGIFRICRRSFVYLERTMENGMIRSGLVGQIDLEEYDFTPGSQAKIRATEATVQERIPPRMKLLEGAKLECPHVILLCDDRRDRIMDAARTVRGETVYDFDLMQDGGHLTGWLISGLGVSVVNSAITDYMEDMRILLPEGETMRFAVGDGNHSLASAKACWEKLKPTLSAEEQLEHPARYALVELENIHDSAIAFEPIHRVLHGVDVQELCYALKQHDAGTGYPITLVHQGVEETFFLSRDESPLALSVLQPVLDEYLQNHPGRIDYIHGDSVVRALAAEPNTLGLILPGMEKEALFPGVLQNGVLPRKTFSMGHAREKRYYLEAKMRI